MDLSSSKKPTDAEDILTEFDSDSEPEQTQESEYKPAETRPEPEPTEPTEPTEPAEPAEPAEPQSEEMNPEHGVVFIGSKPVTVYAVETMTKLSTSSMVTLKARGKKIAQAVDVSQMILKRMGSAGCVISDVRISSETLLSDDDKQRKVSLMEIDISKD
ncbi:MAG: DNA-binding protein [Nitrosopumilus sp. H8]|nr:MAG: DNA-binding protein [Nitrosopumilus sp. H8]